MVIVQICVGSSCHLKGSEEIVTLFQKEIESRHLEDEVILNGAFCTGKCNRVGVTVCVDDDVFTGVTPAGFDAFFKEKVLPRVDA